MRLKTAFYLSFMVFNYLFALSSWGGTLGFLLSYIFLGFIIAIGTMNIAHDALHGAYSFRSFWNRALGLTMDLCGASSFYWKKRAYHRPPHLYQYRRA